MPTILLVEDNKMNRDKPSGRLMRNGYEDLISSTVSKASNWRWSSDLTSS